MGGFRSKPPAPTCQHPALIHFLKDSVYIKLLLEHMGEWESGRVGEWEGPICWSSHYRNLFIKLPDLGLQLPKVSLQNQYVSSRILFIIHPHQPTEHV